MSNITVVASHASKRLLDFWFKGFVPGKPLNQELQTLWFGGSKDVDDKLRALFRDDVERALVDKDFRSSFKASSEGTIALTILLDQIPRNIFRGSPRPFVEFDPLARETVKEALAKQTCKGMHPVYRHLLYMPLEHSESFEDQVTCVQEFRKEYEEVEPLYKDMFKSYLDYAIAHEAVIKKFGRFPHRNEVLGRISTDAEKHHLESGGARW
ncbi:hypothetical protein CPB97_004097 [Podila verticillata]|nr:hypothetical protein CPB97_004097 [Podila verticillata]